MRTMPVYASASAALVLDSPSAILVEQTTGRVLYARNERERRYPAHTTKMLTALVVVEHLALDQVITVGDEIQNMPPGFPASTHAEGDTVTVHTLLRSMLIRSAHESGRILALNVARQTEGRRNIPQYQAERIFAVLMNEKAISLGTVGSHFINPIGVHSENHFTTAYDLAVITRAFMNNEILAEIAGTGTFEYGDFSWTSPNQMLPHGAHGHPYVIGAMTGLTGAAGHVFACAARNDSAGLQLVSIVLGGTDAARWQDTRRLIDFGFFNFGFREIAREGEILDTVQIENPRLGDPTTLEAVSAQAFTALLSHAEYASLTRAITFDPLLYVETETANDTAPPTQATLRAPIEEGETIGRVTYSVNGTVLFEAPVLAAREVIGRSFDSDMDYHLAAFFGNLFTRRGIPFWFGLFGMILGITGITIAIRTHRRARRAENWTLGGKSRYNRY